MCRPEGAEPRSCSRRDRDEGPVPGVCPRYRPPLLCRQTGPATMITGCSGFLGPHKQPPEAQSIADLCQPDSGLQSSCESAGFASAGSGEHALPSTACTWAGFSPGSWGLFPGHPHQALQLSPPGASPSPAPNSDRRATDQLERAGG